ncbi:MAG: carbohydrate ABC transporter permease [Bacillota bacterium]|nr:carbohydrate ABC transporter permease [Bacillota bacterium]
MSTTSLAQPVKKAKKPKELNAVSPAANVIMHAVFILLCLTVLIPLWVIIVASLTPEMELIEDGYKLYAKSLTPEAYGFLFREGSIIFTAYKNTIIATLVGMALSVVSISLYAYPLSRKEFRFRRFFTFVSFFTMLFNAGVVPFYFVSRQILKIDNSIFALFLPLSFSAYWVIVMRTFYTSNVPDGVIESARIDGASEWRTFIQIVLPLAKPGLATVALFSAISIWNNFFNCMLLVDTAEHYNLQYMIYSTLSNARFLSEMATQVSSLGETIARLPTNAFRMAMAGVTMGPIILAYPFFQKYFVKGITLGAIKG